MSTTQTTNLGLTKATPGTGEPFSTSVVNTNLDTIDSAVGELQDSVGQIGTTSLGNGVYYSKSGNMVLVTIINAAIGELATLPTGCRPKVNISNNRGALGIALSGYSNLGYVVVYLDGKITVSANSGSGFTGQVMFSVI